MRRTPPATGPACGHPRDGDIRLIDGGTVPVCDRARCLAAVIEGAGVGAVGEYRYDGPAAA